MKRWMRGAVCVFLLWPAVAQAQLSHVLGLWTLDMGASQLPEQFPLASETRKYTLRDDGYLVVVSVRADRAGNPDFIQIASRPDGKDYPHYQSGPLAEFQINGAHTRFTYSETAVNDYTVEVTGKLDGRVVNKGTRRISDDGNTMTLDFTAYAANGQETSFMLVFVRHLN